MYGNLVAWRYRGNVTWRPSPLPAIRRGNKRHLHNACMMPYCLSRHQHQQNNDADNILVPTDAYDDVLLLLTCLLMVNHHHGATLIMA